MAVDTRNQIGKPDNRPVIWTAIALIAFVIFAYVGYASYRTHNTQTPIETNPAGNPPNR